MGGEPLAAAGEAQTVGCRGAHVDLALADRPGEAPPHLLAVRRDPRLLADEHAIGVDEPPPGLLHLPIGLRQQRQGRGAARVLWPPDWLR